MVEDVKKSYRDVQALDGVSLQVPQGTVTGLLGPNGAGKTTLVRILTTLLSPDSGRASVMNLDVVKDAQKLRSLIGLAGQSTAVDEYLTGRESLELVGRLYHMGARESRSRAGNCWTNSISMSPPTGDRLPIRVVCEDDSTLPRAWWPIRPCCF